MADSDISWTDKVWNVTRGCRRVSAGCGGSNGEGGCYAERQAYRYSGPGQAYEGLVKLTASGPRWTGAGRFVAHKLAEPLSWRKPKRVFVDSMSDLFFDAFTNEQIAAVFGVMAACPQHTFQCLTKRPARMREWFAWIAAQPCDPHTECHAAALSLDVDDVIHTKSRNADTRPWPLPNVWLGVSVENQAAADERIPDLLATPAAVRFLSCEPLLGPLILTPWIDYCEKLDKHGIIRRPGGLHSKCEAMCGISWTIAGCESGPGARPCDIAWLRALRDQCAAAGVPYFLKQAREAAELKWCEATADERAGECEFGVVTIGPGSKRKAGGVIELPYLDGVQHAAFPGATP